MGDLAERILDGDDITVIDVRQDDEWAGGHLPGAVHAPAPDLAGIITGSVYPVDGARTAH